MTGLILPQERAGTPGAAPQARAAGGLLVAGGFEPIRMSRQSLV